MIRVNVVAFVLALMVLPLAFGQDPIKHGLDTQEELKRLDHEVLQAEKNLNLPLLEQLFAPSYTLTLPSGERHDRETWLGILKGPDHPIIESIDATNIQVHLFGDIAVLTDTTTLRSHDSKGQEFNGTFSVLRLMLRQNGKWRVGGVDMSPAKPN
jgi:hypothetical protein